MALKGQAKTDYQREYMRKRRSNECSVRPQLDPILGCGVFVSSSERPDLVIEESVRPTPLDPVKPPIMSKSVQRRLAIQGSKIGGHLKDPLLNAKSDKQATLKYLRELTSSITSHTEEDVSPKIPLYNPSVHKPGDRVMIRNPHTRKLVEAVIPEIDADGNAMPDC